MPLLAEKVAIVTGASRGIGRSIARRFAGEGAQVVLAARSLELLEAESAEIRAAGGHAWPVSMDLRQPDAPAALTALALQKFGKIDIIINNAGATKRGEFLALSEEDWVDGYALKFFGAVRLIRAAWPHLKESGGSVVNIAGVGGRTPGAQSTIGGSVNAALLSLTKALAELGVRDGVQVNAINPGLVRTDRFQARLKVIATQQQIGLAEAEAAMIREMRITRIGEPEDVANLALFLVSPQGRLMHGALLDIDGGETKTI